MKKSLLAIALSAVSVGAIAAMPAHLTDEGLFSAESTKIMSQIDSSGWAVQPEQFGMTPMEFVREEAIWWGNNIVRNFDAGLNNFHHFRTLNKVGDTWVVTPAMDHLYTIGVVDASEPFEFTIPENDGKFISLHLQTMNHTIPVYEVGAGTYKFTPDMFDSRFVLFGVRAATDGTEEDMQRIRTEVQDNYVLKAESGAGDIDAFPMPRTEEMMKVRAGLMEGYNNHVSVAQDKHVEWNVNDVSNWEGFTYVNAGAWGLSPHETAMYPVYAKEGVKGGDCYDATYRAPKTADERGYYSITVYGEDKFLMTNEDNVVSTNQGMTHNEDGTFTIVFGGEKCKAIAEERGVNFAATPADNWGFTLRVYLPDVKDVQDWEATMPEIQPISTK